jgi:hypothetical protein
MFVKAQIEKYLEINQTEIILKKKKLPMVKLINRPFRIIINRSHCNFKYLIMRMKPPKIARQIAISLTCQNLRVFHRILINKAKGYLDYLNLLYY